MTRILRNAANAIESPASSDHFPQAQPDERTLDILTAAHGAVGVISGCTLSLNSPADEYIDVAAGVVQVQNVIATVSAADVKVLGSSPGSAADATNPRITLILADNTGALSQVHGTAADPPLWPDFDQDAYAVLGVVLVHPGVTTIDQVSAVDPHDSAGIVLRNGLIGGGMALLRSCAVTISADHNDWTPSSTPAYDALCSVLRITASSVTRTITGLTGGYHGRTLLLVNPGNVPWVLADQSGSSTNINRFDGNGDITCNAGEGVWIWYDNTGGGTTGRWRLCNNMRHHVIHENGVAQTDRGILDFVDAAAGAGLVTDSADRTSVNLDLYILKALLTTRGDLIRRGASAPERVALGTDGKVLTSDGTDAVWETPIVQVELTNLAQGADKVYYRFPKTLGTHFVTLEIQAQVTPSVGHSFTFMKNGSSVGAVTVTASGTRWTSTVSAFGFTAGDSWSVRHDTNAQDGDESSSHVDEMGRIWAAIY